MCEASALPTGLWLQPWPGEWRVPISALSKERTLQALHGRERKAQDWAAGQGVSLEEGEGDADTS